MLLGRTRVGYHAETMIRVLEGILRVLYGTQSFLFGVGSLGGALLSDSGLTQFGLKIVGAFDVDPTKVGTTINDIQYIIPTSLKSV